MRVAMLLFGVAQALGVFSSALPLRQLHTGDQLRRCCAPRAAVSEAEEAASLEAFAVEARAEDAAARSPSAVALCREAAEAEVAQLQASGDAQLVKLLEASRVVSSGDTVANGDVLRALRKPEGTISIVAEGVPVPARSEPAGTPGTLRSGWLAADLADASWLSEQFRLGGATAVVASTRFSATALAETAREQQSASGDFPGPAPVVARAGFIHPLQLARAKSDGAAAVILPLDLAGADTTRELLACAQRLGLESMVRVCDAAGLDAAVAMGAAAVVLGDISLDEAEVLRARLPPNALSVCDVRLRDLRDVWRARDLGFHALIAGEMLLKTCARDGVEPASLIKAMLAKGSVEFGGGAGKVVSGGGSAYGPCSLPKSMPTFRPINKL